MRILLFVLLMTALPALALEFPAPDPISVTYDALFNWGATTARNDGTPMTTDDIDHYELFYGLQADTSPTMINTAKALSYRVADLPPGEYSAAVRVVDVNGLQSEMSEIVNFTITPDSRPAAPDNFTNDIQSSYTALAVDDCMKSGECVASVTLKWK